MGKRRTREDLIKILKTAFRKKGEPVSIEQFMGYSGIAQATVYRLFGSYPAFVKAAGLAEAYRRKPNEEALEHDVGQGLKLNAEEMKQEIKTLRLALSQSPKASLNEKKIRHEILGLAAQKLDPPKWTVASPKRENNPVVPLFVWSDFHWGEVVRPEEVNGVNSYNLDIAAKRLRTLTTRCAGFAAQYKPLFKMPGAVVCLGGDMVSGDIHDELSETNEQPMGPVMLDLAEKLIWALSQMADAYRQLYVPCVAGNHGRHHRKPRAKRRHWHSWDWLLYQFLERHFKAVGDTRIQFAIPDGLDAAFTVYGHRYLLTHGDNLGVKGGDGIIGAIGPIVRGHKMISQQKQLLNASYDTLIMGHWHRELMLGSVMVNDCLKGYDEWANAQRYEPRPPGQLMWMTHPRHGIFWPMKVYVEEGERRGTGWLEAA